MTDDFLVQVITRSNADSSVATYPNGKFFFAGRVRCLRIRHRQCTLSRQATGLRLEKARVVKGGSSQEGGRRRRDLFSPAKVALRGVRMRRPFKALRVVSGLAELLLARPGTRQIG